MKIKNKKLLTLSVSLPAAASDVSGAAVLPVYGNSDSYLPICLYYRYYPLLCYIIVKFSTIPEICASTGDKFR